MNKFERFTGAGLKTFLGGSCAYGAYICSEVINNSGRVNPIIATVGIGLAAASGVLLKSTAQDVYLVLTKDEDEV